MLPRIFKTSSQFRQWLTKHHATASELYIGHYKKASSKVAMTYAEAVDEALCFGWIDGVVKKVDDEIYMHRWTPRKPGSIWSLVNVRHVERLTAAGKMAPAGLAAFDARTAAKTGVYSFEQSGPIKFSASQLKQFKANKKAWAFWQQQAPGYQRVCTFFVTSAKREDTQARRLATLIGDCAQGVKLAEAVGRKREK
jgi:uncharacterized protein YdeI (YjbR/CyaY-like superfamily)